MGYTLRTYDFELIECLRKLAIICLPIFFRPAGSVAQLIFGLLICFLTFGAYTATKPYEHAQTNLLAQLCQVRVMTARGGGTLYRVEQSGFDSDGKSSTSGGDSVA